MHILNSHKFSTFIISIILVTLFVIPATWPKVKILGYKAIRNLSKYHLNIVTKEFSELSDENFVVKFKPINEESAQIVLENSNEIMGQVDSFLNYVHHEKIPVIVYPSMEELNSSFGWDGDRSPMGVYWMGSIRILTPEAWIDEAENKAIIFKNLGPMAHEYTHLVIDYKTNGNYTRWFTEGVAQYVERKITGFTLDEPTAEAKMNLYPFNVLNDTFDDQNDQELAYWQSLVAIDYLVQIKGEGVVNQILARLGQGQEFSQAFQHIVGQDLNTFEINLREYAKAK
ncbi:MAG: peptidase MA family metallohydrolase [Peptococcales bacterium]|jgi:hypothetical protein